MMTALAAARAYASAAAQTATQAPPASAIPEAGGEGPDFGQLVSKAVTDVVNTSRHAEGQMMAQAQGKADLVDVVTAISSAQASLETVMAVRDQVISAYKEIMAMPI
jgi:flagellar hook-basal body complex protein FliE